MCQIQNERWVQVRRHVFQNTYRRQNSQGKQQKKDSKPDKTTTKESNQKYSRNHLTTRSILQKHRKTSGSEDGKMRQWQLFKVGLETTAIPMPVYELRDPRWFDFCEECARKVAWKSAKELYKIRVRYCPTLQGLSSCIYYLLENSAQKCSLQIGQFCANCRTRSHQRRNHF